MQMEHLWLKQESFSLICRQHLWKADSPSFKNCLQKSTEFHPPSLTLQMNISSKLGLCSPPWTQGGKWCRAKNRLFRLNTTLPASPSLSLAVGFRVYWAVPERGYFRVHKILAVCVTFSINKDIREVLFPPWSAGNQLAPHEGAFTRDHIHLLSFPGKGRAAAAERCENDEVL